MLTDTQLILIGLVASMIVWLLRFAKQPLSAGWLTTAVYGVSFGLAYFFAPLAVPALPPFTDLATFIPALMTWFGALMIPLSAFVGFATLVYNVLLKAVLEKYVRPLFVRAVK